MLDRWRAPFLYRVCLVNTKSDPDAAFQCVIWQTRGAWLVLRDVVLMKTGSEPHPLKGEVIIHRDNVSFVQLVPAP